MALRHLCPVLLLFYSLSIANLQEPFPQGFSMGNQGTILWENGAQGRQPWISAAFCDNSRKFGLACGAVSYFDKMDNLKDESIYKAFGGVYYTIKKFRFKLSISHFSALEMYYEQTGFLSVALDLFTFLRVGTDIRGTRTGLFGFREKIHTIGECGFSAWIPFRSAALGLSLNHITIKSGKVNGVDSPLCISTGFHTSSNRFGAQGVVVEINPSESHPVRFILGEQYRFLKYFALEASIANNPFLIGAGILVEISPVNAAFSIINHPVLGWSRGFAAMY